MRMRWWKMLGLAGIMGVAATGVVIARAERRRRAYTPEEIRARLRERVLTEPGHEDEGEPGDRRP
ncbi:hypothetical protein [Nonomuraea sp. NPDC049400]|uniref:hypothetical protein n=1 Tax=Nonomuraea sp. NPDC049400 TaxID=3364352 RepID=UPI0037AFB2BC